MVTEEPIRSTACDKRESLPPSASASKTTAHRLVPLLWLAALIAIEAVVFAWCLAHFHKESGLAGGKVDSTLTAKGKRPAAAPYPPERKA
jgi:hypothetical protein